MGFLSSLSSLARDEHSSVPLAYDVQEPAPKRELHPQPLSLPKDEQNQLEERGCHQISDEFLVPMEPLGLQAPPGPHVPGIYEIIIRVLY